ncbi:hypothetical protein GQ600_14386 [Phytophthora cactorum]|nr:hypothetical protein GQ600_14386 [Phytophthora cactorum]
MRMNGWNKAPFPSDHGLRKISQDLITPPDEVKEEVDQHKVCPVNELFMAGAYWNVALRTTITSRMEFFATSQFHGNYFFLGNTTVDHTTQHGKLRRPQL